MPNSHPEGVGHRMSKLIWLLPLLAFVFSAAPAQNNHTQLQVVSSALDASTRAITVSLVNRSPKNIVAYVLKLEQFDPFGKLIGLPLTVGDDNVFMLFYGPNHGAIIPPGADFVKQFISAPDAATATAFVVAVVYEDRTAAVIRKKLPFCSRTGPCTRNTHRRRQTC